MKIIAMVPARAGSLRLPGKNIKPLAGKPMLQYAIEEALRCPDIDFVYLNSDSDDYLEIAKSLGAYTYHRPYLLANETACMRDVVKDFCLHEQLKDLLCGDAYSVAVLYPTYPLRTAEDMSEYIAQYKQDVGSPLIGIKKPTTHPYLCFKKNCIKLEPVMSFDQDKFYRQQDYPEMWELTHFACVVPAHMICDLDSQLKHEKRQNYCILHNTGNRLLDIDTAEDFEFAEFLLQKRESEICQRVSL